MSVERLYTDVLIIGGGTAGCYSALTIAEKSSASVLICEKANIKRSGCLSAGVNALNAYIADGITPQDYVDHVREDAEQIVRGDLLITMAERLNSTVERLEKLGLVILKYENGKYVTRGKFNIKINGENIKPILAEALNNYKNISVMNNVTITDLDVCDKKVIGAFGFGIRNGVRYHIIAKSVIVATGGASGLYKPNNPGFSRHKMWYSPFNTGAGYGMGLRAGAEMTSFEMRFIALRCKDTIAPTGTLALGVGAKQINSLGEEYDSIYGQTTSQRIYGTVKENQEGRGPCYLKTVGISKEQDQSLINAYLNMAPSQTIQWIENRKMPSQQNVEIEGTEPYVVGGHTASGFWVDTKRQTTIKGLFSAGDVSGGCPKKFVTGALAEGEIAGEAVLDYIKNVEFYEVDNHLKESKFFEETEQFLNNKNNSRYSIEQIEEAMQTIMDSYAGGIKTNYMFNEKQLIMAEERINSLEKMLVFLGASDYQELMYIYELKDRLLVCKCLIAHLLARKETRWHSLAENADYPLKDDENWLKYVNSVLENGNIKILYRELVKEEQIYEHSN